MWWASLEYSLSLRFPTEKWFKVVEKGLAAGPVAMKVLKKVVIREFWLEDRVPFELPLYITLKKQRMSCSFEFFEKKGQFSWGR